MKYAIYCMFICITALFLGGCSHSNGNVIEEKLIDQPILEEVSNEIICTNEYDPVCGTDAQTYQNKCFATIEEIDIAHAGKC